MIGTDIRGISNAAKPFVAAVSKTKKNPRQFPAEGSFREVSDDRDQKLR
jgi:hypothetical protein